MPDEWLSSRVVARALTIHVNTLRDWAKESTPPEEVAFRMRGKIWRWNPDLAVVRRWVAGLRQTP